MFRVIATLSKVANYIGNSIVSGCVFFGRSVYEFSQVTFHVASNNFYTGYKHTSKYTIKSDVEIFISNNKKEESDPRLAAMILLSFMYPLGLIFGAIIAPVAFYSYKNFYIYAIYPYNFFRNNYEYDGEGWSVTYDTKLSYDGGPWKIMGVPGMLLGIISGSIWTLFAIIHYSFYEAGETIEQAFLFGAGLGNKIDKVSLKDYFQKAMNKDIRNNFRKALGCLLFPFPVAAFILGFVGATSVRIVLNSITSVEKNIDLAIQYLEWDNGKAIEPFCDQRNRYENVLGVLGYAVGALLGIGIFTAGTVVRIFVNSAINFSKIFTHGFYPPLKGTGLEGEPYKFSSTFKFKYSEHILGALGYAPPLALIAVVSGLVLGSFIRIVRETIKSAANTFVFFIKEIALRGRSGNIELNYFGNRKRYENAVGLIGSLLGLAVVTPIVVIIGAIRYSATNVDTYNRVFAFITSPVLKKPDDLVAVSADNRSSFVKVLSFPGATFAVITGGFIRISYESMYSMLNSFKYLIKSSLNNIGFADSNLKNTINDNLNSLRENRTNVDKAWGFLGYVPGFVFSIPAVILIVSTRFVLTNADSAKRAFAKQINPTLNNKISLGKDKRTSFMQKAGLIGHLLGNVAGKFGVASVESTVLFEYWLKFVVSFALIDLDVVNQEIKLPSQIEKYSKTRGIIGLVLGGAVGSIAFVTIGFARLLFNTAQTTRYVALDMIKFVRADNMPSESDFAALSRLKSFFIGENVRSDDNEEVEILLQDTTETEDLQQAHKNYQDKRKNVPFGLGLIGIPLGGVIGTIGALLFGFGRIVKQTSVTALNDGLYYTNMALPGLYNLTNYSIKQNGIDKILGKPLGSILGVILGAVGFSAAGSIRISINTMITAWYATIYIANLPPVNFSANPTDSRNNTDKKLGLIGYIVAIPFGVLAWSLRIVGNVAINSFVNMTIIVLSMVFWSFGNSTHKLLLGEGLNAKFDMGVNARSYFEVYGFGLPGALFAGVISAVVSSLIIISRIIAFNIFTTAQQGFGYFSNLVLKKPIDIVLMDGKINKIKILGNVEAITISNNMLMGLKTIVGIPGYVIGGALGAITVTTPIFIKNLAVDNYNSYLSLSKMLVNLGLEEDYFETGLSTDTRALKNKIVGAPGYFLAISTAGIIPLINILSKAVVVVGIIAFSPLVAVGKLGKMFFNPRFKSHSSDEKEQKFRNLYSSLRDGELVEYEGNSMQDDESVKRVLISENATGGKGLRDFIRKSFILNLNTVTEDVLDARYAQVKDNTTDEGYKERIFNQHKAFFFFTNKALDHHNNTLKDKIDRVDNCINNYLFPGNQ